MSLPANAVPPCAYCLPTFVCRNVFYCTWTELPVGAGDAAACISGNNFGKVRLTFTFYFLSFAKSLPLLRERASTAGRFSWGVRGCLQPTNQQMFWKSLFCCLIWFFAWKIFLLIYFVSSGGRPWDKIIIFRVCKFSWQNLAKLRKRESSFWKWCKKYDFDILIWPPHRAY